MAFLTQAANRQSGEYNIDNSLKFEADNSEYLSKTPQSAGIEKLGLLVFGLKEQNSHQVDT